MSQETELDTKESRKGSHWGLLGVAALVGLAAVALVVVNRTRKDGSRWSVDDLIDAADRAADNLERTLMGEQARAS